MRLGRALDDGDVETPGQRRRDQRAPWQTQFNGQADVVAERSCLTASHSASPASWARYRGWSIVFKHLWPDGGVADGRWRLHLTSFGTAAISFGRLRGMTPESVEPRLGAVFAHVDQSLGPRAECRLRRSSTADSDISQRSTRRGCSRSPRRRWHRALCCLRLRERGQPVVRIGARRAGAPPRWAAGGRRCACSSSSRPNKPSRLEHWGLSRVRARWHVPRTLLPYSCRLDEIGLDARVLAFAVISRSPSSFLAWCLRDRDVGRSTPLARRHPHDHAFHALAAVGARRAAGLLSLSCPPWSTDRSTTCARRTSASRRPRRRGRFQRGSAATTRRDGLSSYRDAPRARP